MAECFFQRLKQEENFHEAVPTMTQGTVDKLFHLSITLENLEEVLRRGRTELVCFDDTLQNLVVDKKHEIHRVTDRSHTNDTHSKVITGARAGWPTAAEHCSWDLGTWCH